MAPIRLGDGTGIDSVRLGDGTSIAEITVDGDVVFSAQQLPVAFSNLIAWYPFDSATYGGSNTDDVTSIIGGSGDDTNFSLSAFNNAPNYLNSGGIVDINGGAGSGAFDFNGSNEAFVTGVDSSGNFNTRTITAWFNGPDQSSRYIVGTDDGGSDWGVSLVNGGFRMTTGSSELGTGTFSYANSFHFFAAIWEPGVRTELYVDGNSTPLLSSTQCTTGNANPWAIGNRGRVDIRNFDGIMDDVRIYDKALSTSEINQIYQNTEP
jgi:hypothetical protein